MKNLLTSVLCLLHITTLYPVVAQDSEEKIKIISGLVKRHT